jgi:hypothetical protein
MTPGKPRPPLPPTGAAHPFGTISLRMINSGINYDTHFPVDYEEGHTSGPRLLRVAARAKAEHGRAVVGPY